MEREVGGVDYISDNKIEYIFNMVVRMPYS